jgi:N-acetylglutamate synthase-like GNAT family acetyltransferase
MTYRVRFGNSDDLEMVTAGDQSVAESILNWKLENEEIVLAEIEDELVGYLRLEYLWSKFPYIGLIMVRPDNQKRGAGRAMLHFVEENLRARGNQALYSSSQADEAAPQKWHRHMGFAECGIISGINPGNVGEIFFVKSL